MSHKKLYKSLLSRVFVIGLAILVGVGYVLFSYQEAWRTSFDQIKSRMSLEKRELTDAFQGMRQYVDFTSLRLSHSIDREEVIARILQEKIEDWDNGTLPLIMSAEFILTSHPHVAYTRLGKTVSKENRLHAEEGIVRLNGDVFRITKHVHDEKKNLIGVLSLSFSIAPLLRKHFKKEEIQILPGPGQLPLWSFTVEGVPYVFSVSQRPPSLWQFMVFMRIQLIAALVFGIILLMAGLSLGRFLSRRIFKKQHTLISTLKDDLKAAQEKDKHVTGLLKLSDELSKLKSKSAKMQNELVDVIHQRSCEMAVQAQSINLLTSQLILEEAGHDKLLQEIHSVSQEGTSVLRQLANGFLMKGKIEEVDVLQSLIRIKDIFWPELLEMQSALSITGKVNNPLHTDQLVFDVTLYNIFHLIMARFLEGNTLQINMKDGDPFQVIFYDNGYDMEGKLHKIKKMQQSSNTILRMDKAKLEEFVNYLGWQLSFEKGTNLLNTITLSIPRELSREVLPSNVVNLFGHKSHDT